MVAGRCVGTLFCTPTSPERMRPNGLYARVGASPLVSGCPSDAPGEPCYGRRTADFEPIGTSKYGGIQVQVRDGMSDVVVTVGPSHTLRDAAALMRERRVGSAVVTDPEQPGPGILTERDILLSVGSGEDPSAEKVADHLTANLVFAAPDWSLEEAAAAMVRGGLRHLIVVDGG